MVTLLWGTVIYRYVNNLLIKKELPTRSNTFVASDISKKIIVKDTFTLPEITRDPFLNAIKVASVYKKPIVRKPNPPVTVIPKKEPIPVVIPTVQYYGYIKSTASTSELFMLRIDGKLHKLKLNQEAENFKITESKKDSIKLLYNGKAVQWVRIRK